MLSFAEVKEPPALKSGTVKALAVSLGASLKLSAFLPVDSWPDNERPAATYAPTDDGRDGETDCGNTAHAASDNDISDVLNVALTRPRRAGRRPRS